jgi:hypothetical protein
MFYQATQPVSLASVPSHPVTNAGTFAVQAASTQVLGSGATRWYTQISDGTNSPSIKAASTAAVAADPAIVVAVSPNNSVTVSQATAANLNATVTGTVELGATSLAALENISITVPGTIDLGTVSLTALESITAVSGTPGNFQSKVYGAVTSAAPAYTNATDNALSLTTSGSLRTTVAEALPAGTNAIGKLAANDGVDIGDVTINNASIPVTGTFWQATQPVSGTVTVNALPTGTNSIGNINTVTNLSQLGGAAISMGTGVRGSGVQRVTIATDDIVPASQSGTWNINTLTSITNALPAGTNAIGKLATNSGVTIGAVEIAASQTIAITQATASNLNATVSIAASQTLATVTNLSQLGGAAIAMGTGVRSVGTQRVTIATDDLVPLSGPLTDTQLRATAVPVSGPLTDTQLRATALPVSGTVTANAGTGSFTVAQATASNLNATVSIAGSQTLATVTNLTQFNGTAITMKAASVAAVAADPALVVAISPNNTVQTAATPQSAAAYSPTNATTTAYVSNLVAKASAGTLYCITGFNSRTSSQFIQVHNATATPTAGAVPSMIFIVPASSNFSLDLTPYGRYFSTGITVCNSSTGPTLTVGSADCWFDVQYK